MSDNRAARLAAPIVEVEPDGVVHLHVGRSHHAGSK